MTPADPLDWPSPLPTSPFFRRWVKIEMKRLAAHAYDAMQTRHAQARLPFRGERRLVENRIVESMQQLLVATLEHFQGAGGGGDDGK